MTDRYALVGTPIDRSPSPAMQNAAFQALGIDARYELRPAAPDDVARIVDELESGAWQGLNVTTPLKTLLARHVRLTGHATRAGAVNTIWKETESLAGALTDVEGVVEPLRRVRLVGNGSGLRAERPAGDGLILGAGGAARAAVLALEELGLGAHVAARDPSRAEHLLTAINPARRGQAVALADRAGLASLCPDLGVIIQATPVGRDGSRHDLPWSEIAATTVAFDMVYEPRRTPFLIEAAARGCTIIEGREMLLAQGAASFQIWTGRPAPLDAMRAALPSA